MLGPPIAFVATTDAAAARPFYEETLGLELVADQGPALVFRLGAGWLRVTVLAEHSPPPFTVLGWQVADIGAAVTELASRGVRSEHFEGMPQDHRGICTFPNGDRVGWFRDPAGNMLSITQLAG